MNSISAIFDVVTGGISRYWKLILCAVAAAALIWAVIAVQQHFSRVAALEKSLADAQVARQLEAGSAKVEANALKATIDSLKAQRDQAKADQKASADFAATTQKRVKDHPEDEGSLPPVFLDTARQLR